MKYIESCSKFKACLDENQGSSVRHGALAQVVPAVQTKGLLDTLTAAQVPDRKLLGQTCPSVLVWH